MGYYYGAVRGKGWETWVYQIVHYLELMFYLINVLIIPHKLIK